MRYRDRADAGEQLAREVRALDAGPAVVLGVPRGGVLVAAPIARALAAPLDVIVTKKLGAPFNPELGIGAVAPGVRILDEGLIDRLGVSGAYLEGETARELDEIDRRTRLYREGRPPLELAGVTAVIVDDGVATGGTALAAVASARAQAAERVAFAAPVAPPGTVARLAASADDVVVLQTPAWFSAVGEWYERFDQVTDEEVQAALASVT